MLITSIYYTFSVLSLETKRNREATQQVPQNMRPFLVLPLTKRTTWCRKEHTPEKKKLNIISCCKIPSLWQHHFQHTIGWPIFGGLSFEATFLRENVVLCHDYLPCHFFMHSFTPALTSVSHLKWYDLKTFAPKAFLPPIVIAYQLRDTLVQIQPTSSRLHTRYSSKKRLQSHPSHGFVYLPRSFIIILHILEIP